MIIRRFRSRAMALAATMLAAAPLVISPMVATPAHAIIVFDPSNYAQNVLTAARSLEQITGYRNDKTYNLGSTVVGPFNDAYYRRVYSTTVPLRNSNRLKLQAM